MADGRAKRGQADETLTALTQQVATDLASSGWVGLGHTGHHLTILTRPMDAGLIATVEINRASFSFPDPWPIELYVDRGVGYQPALDLMPVLALGLRASIVRDPAKGDGHDLRLSVSGSDDIEAAAGRIVDFVEEHGATFAATFHDLAGLEARFEADCEAARQRAAAHRHRHDDGERDEDADSGEDDSGDDDDDDDDDDPARVDLTVRLVLLAATGRHDEARAELATYPPAAERGRWNRRFPRQLTRWLDAGGPTPPPVLVTLAAQPLDTPEPLLSLAERRAESRARRAVVDDVRTRAKGKSVAELEMLLAAEFAHRGIAVAASTVAAEAEIVRLRQRPFGRTLAMAKVARMIKLGGGELIHRIKTGHVDDPDWLRPPERAAFPVAAGRRPYGLVIVDAGADSILDLVATEAPSRVATVASVDAWLTRDASGSVVVHIGQQRVGVLADPAQAEAFAAAFRAAAPFDEDLVIRARLTQAEGHEPGILEVAWPRPADPAPG